MRTAEGFLLIFALNSRYSFSEALKFAEQVKHVKDMDHVPFILIGYEVFFSVLFWDSNKCDLEAERQVTTSEGIKLARFLDCPYYETSYV